LAEAKPGIAAHTRPWWRGAIFYEIYVRSFADSNDDGVGDLPGITSRLDYLKGLGVDAIWLTPFYPSPQKDHGYDVADYFNVNPEYGTLDDLNRLVGRAHELKLKVLVDLVGAGSPLPRALLLPGPQGRRLAAEQLGVGVRRTGLDAGRAQRPVVPAPLCSRAAGPQLVES
jgi:hypothetical protein